MNIRPLRNAEAPVVLEIWRRSGATPSATDTAEDTSLLDAAERTMTGWGARRVSALVEHEHGWATSFWESAGYEADRKMARYVRSLDPGAEHATRIASAEVPSAPHDRGEN